MVEFVAAALIASGFWMLLELGKLVINGLPRETAAMRVTAGPGREYVERYADAFRRLAESYQDMPRKKEHFGDEEMEHIISQIRERMCASCPQQELCWQKNYYESCRRIFAGLRAMENGDEAGALETLGFMEFCCMDEELLQAMKEIFLQERVTLMWNNRMLEQRAAAGEQLQDTAELLKQMAERLYQIRGLEERTFRRLEKELRYEKIDCAGAWLFCRDEEHPELYVSMGIREGSCIQTKDLSELISEVMGRRMVPARDCRLTVKKEPDTFHYITDTNYQMFCGIARMTRDGELVSGDNFAFWQGDCGQVIMSLADGMGTGVEACQESEKVIELLEQFLDAGFSQDTAMRMINSSMVLQDHMQIFSTIDLCMVDLYNGKCCMIKAGACPTYLSRGDGLEVIHCQALPAGLLQTPDYETVNRQLASGDRIIMMTDGVTDALEEDGREMRLRELILETKTNNAREYARSLLEQVLARQRYHVKDDMTVLVGQIWKK
ncbi:MAG: SpoIIE family protein phosphatase [Lachnospiraceae bacterium]|nr:SpoIIE family protein phosphatase [Lachnospiraceae bacterium]